MDNFRNKLFSADFMLPPVLTKLFCSFFVEICFFMCLLCAHTLFWFESDDKHIKMLHAQFGVNWQFLDEDRPIFS